MLKNIREMTKGKEQKPAGKNSNGKNAASNNAGSKDAGSESESELSINDPLDKRRAKAVALHHDAQAVLQLARADNSELVRESAARRYSQLITDSDASRTILDELLQSSTDRPLFFAISAASNEESLRLLSLEKSQTDDDRLIIAEKARFHDIRMQAARQLQSIDAVDKCWRNMKTRDKLVARELKSRLDKERLAKESADLQSSQLEKILTEMDKIANGVWQPSSANRFDHFSDQWDQLDFDPPAALKDRYAALHTVAEQKATEWRSKQSTGERRQSILDRLQELSETLNNTTETDLANTVSASKSSLKRQRDQWQELASAEQENNQSQQERYQSLQKSLTASIATADIVVRSQSQLNADSTDQRQLKTLSASLEKIKNQNGTAAWLSVVPQLLEKSKVRLEQKSSADSELKKQIHKQLGSLNSAIAAKRWGPARSIHERAARKIARLESKDKTSYTEKLTRLESKLKELGDWKEFASEPKLIELCEQMEKVPSLKLSPNDSADRIKELQTQWKAMGASPAQEKHWSRFKTAADTAYEPCKKFFTARREEKKNKLATRRQICELLEQYEKNTDWSAPDWRSVEKTLRTAKREWKENQIFDRKRGKPLEDRFTKILKLIDEKLDPVYDANAAVKKDLIEKITKLGDAEITQHSINQVKSLQSAWRLSGACRQKEDRALWQEFSSATNKIFDAHRSKKREEHAASFEHVRRAREIIKTLSSAGRSASPLSDKEINALQEEYAALAEFPERDEKKLARDYRKALDAIDQYRQKTASDNRKRALQSLQNNADLCAQLESLAGQPWATIETQADNILDEWQDADKGENQQAAKSVRARRDSILELLKSDEKPDYQKNEAARRLLCIELEILCDRETPAEDKAMRMQHQLDKLQQGLQSSTAAGTVAEQVERLQLQWLTGGPAEPTVQEKLNSRFNQIIESAH